jgi:geranylgeranyl pyrophosphate synthase
MEQQTLEATPDAAALRARLAGGLADNLADNLSERDGFDSTVAAPLGTANGTAHAASLGDDGASGSSTDEPLAEGPLTVSRRVDEVEILRSLEGLKPQLKEVEAEIERLVSSSVKTVADVASHTLGAGGKRLRPALTILAAMLCDAGTRSGALGQKVLSGAVAVELTHTTTLLHDDVVDGAQVRRGKPAANLLWGNGLSVLVGDYLFAQVFLIASQQGFYELMNPLAQATAQMCAGELLEVQRRRDLSIPESEYEEIVALKTAALTECSCRIGAIAGAGDEEQTKRLAAFGYNIGIAFQIVDDVFDIASSKVRIGKPVGNDIREGVVTLPMLRAMAELSQAEQDELRDLLGKDPIEDSDVARALELIRSTSAIELSRRTALDYVARAKAQLRGFDDCAARDMLCDIADYVVSREK